MSNEQTKLTPEQIERIEVAIAEMARRDNAVCQGIARGLEKSKQLEDKRRYIAMVYAQLYETMIGFNLALDSTRSVEEIKAALKESGLPK